MTETQSESVYSCKPRPLQCSEDCGIAQTAMTAIPNFCKLQAPDASHPPRKRHRGEPEQFLDYLWWASRKKMKKAGVLYASEYEDRITFPERYPIAWTTLRQLQCHELSVLLVMGNPAVPPEIQKDLQTSIVYELEGVIEYILRNTKACVKFPLGTSALWVILLFQQLLTLSKGVGSTWHANSSKEARAIGIEAVSAYLTSKVTGKIASGSWRKLSAIEGIEVSADRKKESAAFRLLLSKAKPDPSFCPIRMNCRDAPWLFSGIEELELPLHADDAGVSLKDESTTISSHGHENPSDEDSGQQYR